VPTPVAHELPPLQVAALFAVPERFEESIMSNLLRVIDDPDEAARAKDEAERDFAERYARWQGAR
jgi:hypothetical protein